MKHSGKCIECGSSDIRTAVVSAGGGHAPDLLPGAHPWWWRGRLEVYICCTCGYFQYFVPEDALAKVRESTSFSPAR